MPSNNNDKSSEPVVSVLKLPTSAQDLFDHYRKLRIQDLQIVCPYHINTGLRGRHRALVGKGRPEEIEAAAERYLDKFQMHARGDVERLERYLVACGFGIDCSGFAAWMLNCLTLDTLHKPLQRCLIFPNVKRSLVSKVRPFENISANLLTNARNAQKITDINQVRPGDLIRLIHGGHVVVISEVGLTKQGIAVYFKYMQSTVGYGNRKGVQEDEVLITNPDGYLLEQSWTDNLIHADLKRSGDDARIVRLRAFQNV
jgi:hypothetical protein